MAKPEWGTKRICQNCTCKFYDLARSPIICPKCQTEFDPEAFLKTRRPRAVSDKEVAPIAAAVVEPGLDIEDAELVEEGDELAEAEDEAVIEDTSELGEDSDDMAEVIEKVDEEDDR